jgi:hypothetical protein
VRPGSNCNPRTLICESKIKSTAGIGLVAFRLVGDSKIVLLHLRANTAQEIVDPSCKERITSHGDFHPHVRRRQPLESAALARHRYSQGRTEKWNHSRSYRAEYYRASIFYRHPLAFWQSLRNSTGDSCVRQPRFRRFAADPTILGVSSAIRKLYGFHGAITPEKSSSRQEIKH